MIGHVTEGSFAAVPMRVGMPQQASPVRERVATAPPQAAANEVVLSGVQPQVVLSGVQPQVVYDSGVAIQSQIQTQIPLIPVGGADPGVFVSFSHPLARGC